jgi:hypothetical protein
VTPWEQPAEIAEMAARVKYSDVDTIVNLPLNTSQSESSIVMLPAAMDTMDITARSVIAAKTALTHANYSGLLAVHGYHPY